MARGYGKAGSESQAYGGRGSGGVNWIIGKDAHDNRIDDNIKSNAYGPTLRGNLGNDVVVAKQTVLKDAQRKELIDQKFEAKDKAVALKGKLKNFDFEDGEAVDAALPRYPGEHGKDIYQMFDESLDRATRAAIDRDERRQSQDDGVGGGDGYSRRAEEFAKFTEELLTERTATSYTSFQYQRDGIGGIMAQYNRQIFQREKDIFNDIENKVYRSQNPEA